MKNLILTAVLLLSSQAFAQTKMGDEAKEMFNVLSNHQAQECLKDLHGKLINLSIEKKVFRCPGCTTYVVSGNRLKIDVPEVEKTVLTLKGFASRGFGGQFVQGFECSVEN